MRIDSLVPVQETFQIDDIADLQFFHCLIYVGGIVAQIGLYREGIGVSIQ